MYSWIARCFLTPEQTTALLADLEDPRFRPSPLSASTLLLQLSEPAG